HPHRGAWVWLLAAAVAAFGPDEAWAAAHHHHAPTHLKHARAHRTKGAEAQHYKYVWTRSRKYAGLRHSRRIRVAVAYMRSTSSPAERRAASLAPNLAAVKQA